MYQFKRVSPEYYLAIQKLSKKAFGINRKLDEIKRKYETGSFGNYTIGYLAESEDGNPAAYYGVFPLRFTYNNSQFVVAQSGDTMTSPDHQRKGLFTQLAEKTYHDCQNENIAFVFGFPNANSLPGFQRKLNWTFYGAMNTFTIDSLGLPFCELSEKFKFLKPIHRSFVKWRLRSKCIQLNEGSIRTFSEQTSIGSSTRDVDYFRYKLADPTNFLIEVNGFRLLIKVEAHLRIGAVGFFSAEQNSYFIDTIKKLAKQLACKKAVFSMSENHWLYERLKTDLQPKKGLQIGFFQINPDFEYGQIEFIQADFDTF